jgi:hypothetical protein
VKGCYFNAIEDLNDFQLAIAKNDSAAVGQSDKGSQAIIIVSKSVNSAKVRLLDIELIGINSLFGKMPFRGVNCPEFHLIALANSHCVQSQVINGGADGLFGVGEVVTLFYLGKLPVFVSNELKQFDFTGPSSD